MPDLCLIESLLTLLFAFSVLLVVGVIEWAFDHPASA